MITYYGEHRPSFAATAAYCSSHFTLIRWRSFARVSSVHAVVPLRADVDTMRRPLLRTDRRELTQPVRLFSP